MGDPELPWATVQLVLLYRIESCQVHWSSRRVSTKPLMVQFQIRERNPDGMNMLIPLPGCADEMVSGLSPVLDRIVAMVWLSR